MNALQNCIGYKLTVKPIEARSHPTILYTVKTSDDWSIILLTNLNHTNKVAKFLKRL